MKRIVSEAALLEAFRPFERAEVELPRGLSFPFGLKDYLAWPHPAGGKVFLVFEEPSSGVVLGVVFKRGSLSGEAPSAMCEWCHSIRAGDGVTMLTATASDRKRVGVSLCSDLDCKERMVEGLPGADDMPTGLSRRERARRITQKMSELSRKHLF